MSNSSSASRRRFLSALAGLAALPACKAASKQESETAPDDPCMDVRALSEADRATRTSTNYIAVSPFTDMRCDTCQFWLPAQGTPCGGCVVVKGPIHPAGHCTSFAPA